MYDFHDVIRTKILRTLLKSRFFEFKVIKKERHLKKKIIKKKISLKKLKHTTERYLECLYNHFPGIINIPLERSITKIEPLSKKIGIAPFAAHSSKIWPIENYHPILSKFEDYEIIIFAFGEREIIEANKLIAKHKNCSIIPNNTTFNHQMNLINEFDVFISMDSANMHLGCLTSTAIISIWGPTHYYLGFGPLFNEENIIQISHRKMTCRPCSIYGKIKSKDVECSTKSMKDITPDMVIKKIEDCL